MKVIDKADVDKAKEASKEESTDLSKSPLLETKHQIALSEIEKGLEQPTDAMKNLAARIKVYLDERIPTEMREFNVLTQDTRKWVSTYNDILEKLQRGLHGDKSISFNLHKVTHSTITADMRQSEGVEPLKDGKPDTDETEDDAES